MTDVDERGALEARLLASLKDHLPALRQLRELEAFFHANYFLDMAIKYGEELDEPPSPLPSGWAAVLYLYNIR